MEEFLNYRHFIKNKYYFWYKGIISKAFNERRVYNSSVYEKHHILPDSLGGSSMVCLTFREHYICHELLTRFTTGKDKMKMCFALHTFFHFDFHKPTTKKSILYKKHKEMFIQACKERIPWYKSDILYIKNRKTNEELIGTRKEIKENTNLDAKGIVHLLHNAKIQRKFHILNWGLYIEELNCFTYDIPRKKAIQHSYICEHCNKSCNRLNYKRWHGDNCKKKS